MNLSYLSLLALGKVPEEDFQYKDLNAARKKRVAGFVNNIPQKYSLDEINSDVQKLSAMKDSFIFNNSSLVLYFLRHGADAVE